MLRIPAIAVPIALVCLSGCQSVGALPSNRIGQATLRHANGLPAGTAQLLAGGTDVTLTVAVAGLSEGAHGIHLHTTGKCDGPDFTTAGGHLNPGGHQHGSENPAGKHLGDLPNIAVGNSGAGTVTVTLGQRDDVVAALFDADGTAIVVHAGPDDYRTDPAGNSGGRVACGVFTRG